MNCNALPLFALLAGAVFQANAGTMGAESDRFAFVATLSAGPAWANGGETQTFYLTDDIIKTYAADTSWAILGSGEFFAGAQKALNSKIKGQLGLALGVAGNAGLQGMVWDDADPQFDNYMYRYKVLHTRVAAKGKLIADGNYWLMPWISGSVGVAFNVAHGFQNQPTITEAIANANFSDHTTTAFTYTAGVGVQKALSPHWQMGLGYEFADWGKSELGRAQGQTLNSGLALNHLYTHAAMLNLTFIG